MIAPETLNKFVMLESFEVKKWIEEFQKSFNPHMFQWTKFWFSSLEFQHITNIYKLQYLETSKEDWLNPRKYCWAENRIICNHSNVLIVFWAHQFLPWKHQFHLGFDVTCFWRRLKLSLIIYYILIIPSFSEI